MSDRVLRVRGEVGEQLRADIATIREQLHVSDEFPPEVEAAAKAAAAAPKLPDADHTDIPFLTIDPPGSMDLDQAMHIERDGDGYVVHYAIADVAAFVEPGGPIDVEANKRGETLYGADSTVPLHPRVLSEGATSLLPDQIRPAIIWTLKLDKHGEVTDARAERAKVRSTARLDYEGVQKSLDDGSASDTLKLLKEVGQLRVAIEVDRGGVNLPMPEQEIVVDGDNWSLEYRQVLPVENWNAQISLVTGFAAASMMIAARVGILRTLPPPAPESIKRLHRTAKALGVDWPAEQHYPDFIRGLDANVPAQAAMIVACTSLLRGAGYAGFNGEVPAQPEHAALASEYAHVTAPLRRLVDRYGNEVCVALTAGQPVPQWVLDKLHDIPDTMQQSGRLAHQYENEIVNLVEATTLQSRVGESFDGVVLELEHDEPTKGDLMVRDPAIEARVVGSSLKAGDEVHAKLVEADPTTRTVRFEV
ncbi:MAG TPA: RNB domain-containing ribonuclease [Marmoricola sp.]